MAQHTSVLVNREEKNITSVVAQELLRFGGSLALVLVLYGVPMLLFANGTIIESAVMSLLFVSITALILSLLSPVTALLVAILAAVFQNAILGVLHDGSGNITVVISETKTIIAFILAGVLLLKAVYLQRSTIPLFLTAVVFGLYTIGHNAGLDASFAANARNFLGPVLLMLALAAYTPAARALPRVQLYVMVSTLSVVLVLGSLLEYAVGSRQWKALLNVEHIAGLNALSEQTIVFGRTATRVGGFLVEPINAGYVASFVLIFALIEIIRQLFVCEHPNGMALGALGTSAVFLIITISLAATKNSILVVATGIIAYVLLLWWRNHRHWAFWASVAIGTVLTFAYTTMVKGPSYIVNVWTNPVGTSGGESSSIHIAGLLSGLYSIADNPLGFGVGSGGNFYRLYNPEIPRHLWLESGGESAIGTLVFQMGIIGLLLLAYAIYLVLPRLDTTGVAVLAAWFAAALFSEATFGSIVTVPTLAFAAYLSAHSDPALPRGASTMQNGDPA
ncbi:MULTISPECIES: hypothetical protein [Corynebacterium]|uniref:hypothetical protein n=1 Tax=Corynebacterium TaxID=1716 RepID=UPI00124C4CFF|nr:MULTISPECIES: hypothetical protein [Corynebacterium]